MKRHPLYIETRIKCAFDVLWERTQDPSQHQLWDLRFSEIHYLPKSSPEEPQRFRYATRIGFGLAVEGVGESVAARTTGKGESTSVLKFGSENPLSLIREGSGYWKYAPEGTGIRFWTGYDYRTRWGFAGAVFDRWVFRPLMVRATAWSFDRLKNWIEKGIHPRQALISQLTVSITSLTLGSVWIYQGLFPKLLFKHTGEFRMLAQAGLFPGHEADALNVLGCAEVFFGAAVLFLQDRRTHWLSLLALPVLGAGALLCDPGSFLRPFNPLTFNLALMALSAVALIHIPAVPKASNCKTRQVP
ncbi:MAG: DoxX-like family protein [Fibrobacteres bacterium]|nr:DoxX-like family protein [Fibrobacterota bacterium]